MENDFIFWCAVILAFIMTIVALATTKYAADVKEETIGLEGWNEWKQWKKDRDDLILQVNNWEDVLERIEEAANKREDNPELFPDPVEALAIQLTNDYTLINNE